MKLEVDHKFLSETISDLLRFQFQKHTSCFCRLKVIISVNKILIGLFWKRTSEDNLDIKVLEAILWVHESFVAFSRLNFLDNLLISFVFLDDVCISFAFVNKIDRSLRSVTLFR